MDGLSMPGNASMLAELHHTKIQKYAKIAAVLFLLSIIGGGFGEFYVPTTLIVTGDATATANNILTHNTMFRFGFAMYLVEAVCDIGLVWILYVLLRPVHREIALLAAFFGLVSTAVFAASELFFFAATFILDGGDYLNSFSRAQINSLGLLSVRFYGYGAGIFMVFYGIAAIVRGYLMFKSTYLPRLLGALFVIAGVGFVTKSFTLVLAPAYASDFLMMPMALAGLAFTAWMFIKGIDVAEWKRATGTV